MFMQFWAALWCPVLAGLSGYLLRGNFNGVTAGFLAYGVLAIGWQASRHYDRADYWASKLAMLKAEEAALQQALDAVSLVAVSAEDKQTLASAYRTRLAVLRIQRTALRAGYRSYKSAGVFGHFSERKGGLLPDATG